MARRVGAPVENPNRQADRLALAVMVASSRSSSVQGSSGDNPMGQLVGPVLGHLPHARAYVGAEFGTSFSTGTGTGTGTGYSPIQSASAPVSDPAH